MSKPSRLKMIPGVACGLIVGTLAGSVAAQPVLVPGDWLVGSRNFGTVLKVNPADAELISGRDLSTASMVSRGSGLSLVGVQLDLLAMSEGQLLGRASQTTNQQGTYSIDVATGNRTILPGTGVAPWTSGGGGLLRLDQDNVLALVDDFGAGTAGNGRLVRYTISTGESTLVSGGTRGNGVVIHRPRAMCRFNAHTVAVVEFGPNAQNALPGALVYLIDLTTGDRTVVSTPGQGAPQRFMCVDGVVSAAPVAIPGVGWGPVSNGQFRGIAYQNGLIYVSGSLGGTFEPFIMGIIPADGGRTLVGGTALYPERVTVPFGAGSTTVIPEAPASLVVNSDHSLLMCAVFGPNRVWQLDTNTRQLTIVADMDPAVLAQYRGPASFSSLTVVPVACTGVPQIVSPTAAVSACAGATASVSVSVGGPGETYFQWRKNGVPINSVFNASAATATLTISTIHDPDTALYDCVVTNWCGSVTSGAAQVFVDPSDMGVQGGQAGRDGVHDNNDFVVLIDYFFSEDPRADLGRQGGVLGSDGLYNSNDFVVFIDRFFAGC
ncbi:MAG: immunoglobulin domain-containing protein [Phycisphaerales bacterium]|nr:immunoglobulin domain-containing protein [Phycisphaerales bacterium]